MNANKSFQDRVMAILPDKWPEIFDYWMNNEAIDPKDTDMYPYRRGYDVMCEDYPNGGGRKFVFDEGFYFWRIRRDNPFWVFSVPHNLVKLGWYPGYGPKNYEERFYVTLYSNMMMGNLNPFDLVGATSVYKIDGHDDHLIVVTSMIGAQDYYKVIA